MFIYNQLTELFFTQFLLLAVYEVIVFGVSVFIFKQKVSWKILLWPAVFALALSLVSSIIAQGDYSGTTYREKFGWPFQYSTMMRYTDPGTPVAAPYLFQFDTLRFIANTAVWGFFPFMIVLAFSDMQRKRVMIFAVSTLCLFMLLIAGFSYDNSRRKKGTELETAVPITELLPNPSSETQNEMKSWNTYQNATYHFEVQYPSDYFVFHQEGDSQFDVDAEACRDFLENGGAEWPRDCQSYTILVQENAIEAGEIDDVNKTMTVAGFSAEQIETTGGMWDNLDQIVVQFQKDEMWYIHTFRFHTNERASAEEVMEDILASFRFINE